MRVEEWSYGGDPGETLQRVAGPGCLRGVCVVRFEGRAGEGSGIGARQLERWLRSRPVTVAHVAASLRDPALGFALCFDLVYFERGTSLELPPPSGLPTPALIYAAGRAGPRALRRVLLGDGEILPDEAVALGLVHGVLDPEEALPLPLEGSAAALTAARDLLRSNAGTTGALALESATFRLLFAGGDPEEGASAFLERRPPDFGQGRGP